MDLTIIGTGHVFRIADAVKGAILHLRPEHVFVELDPGRLAALQQRQTGQTHDAGGFVHKRLQRFQDEMAKAYGAQAGEEMLAAVEAARMVGADVHLIDPPAEDTIKSVLKQLTWAERLRIVGLVVKGTAKSIMPGRRERGRQEVEAEIARYQQDPTAVLAEMQHQFPTVHRILIAERDERMAAAIRERLTGKGVAVIGDGHVNGIVEILGPVRVYRLADVREGRLPGGPPVAVGTTEKVSFGFDAWAPPQWL